MGGPRQTIDLGHVKVSNAGEAITVAAALWDYDSWSSNDVMCNVARNLGPFTEAQLKAMDQGFSLTDFSNDRSCRIEGTLRRVY